MPPEYRERAETIIEIPQFSKEQMRGLYSMGFDLGTRVQGKSLTQLSLQEPTYFVQIELRGDLAFDAPSTEVAVRSKQLYIPQSNNLSYYEQWQMVKRLENAAKRKSLARNATLEGVTFGLGHALYHVLIDKAYRKRNPDRPPLYREFVRTVDRTDGLSFGQVGRYPGDSGLRVIDYSGYEGTHSLWAAPVAMPSVK